MVQIVDSLLVVPSLDVPMPQMEHQLVEACQHLDLPIPEQVIPKISSSSRRYCERQVPVVLSFSSLHGLVEQINSWSWWSGRSSRFTPWTGFASVFLEQITLTFQFRVVEVFKVFALYYCFILSLTCRCG